MKIGSRIDMLQFVNMPFTKTKFKTCMYVSINISFNHFSEVKSKVNSKEIFLEAAIRWDGILSSQVIFSPYTPVK